MNPQDLNLKHPRRVKRIEFGDKIQLVRFQKDAELEILQDSVVPFVKHFSAVVTDTILAFKPEKMGFEIELKESGRFFLPYMDGSTEGVIYLAE
jgi:hypothetical protein